MGDDLSRRANQELNSLLFNAWLDASPGSEKAMRERLLNTAVTDQDWLKRHNNEMTQKSLELERKDVIISYLLLAIFIFFILYTIYNLYKRTKKK